MDTTGLVFIIFAPSLEKFRGATFGLLSAVGAGAICEGAAATAWVGGGAVMKVCNPGRKLASPGAGA